MTRKKLAMLLFLASTAGFAGSPRLLMDSSVIVDDQNRVPNLICPGSQGCVHNLGPMFAGVAAVDITPVVETWDDDNGNGVWDEGESFDDLNGNSVWDPVWLAGFFHGRAATGAHDPQWARALSLVKGETRIGLVALDLVGLFHDDTIRIRLAAAEAGLEVDHIMVVTTHTHSGGDTQGFSGPTPDVTGQNPDYRARVVAAAVSALATAIERETPVTLTVGSATAPHLVADSRLPLVKDDALLVLRFDSKTGVVATLTQWGNHPEALGPSNTLLSSDYVHYLRDALEAAYPGSLAIFVPGNVGGLMTPMDAVGCPDENGEETCPTGTFEKAQYIGEQAAAAALDSLSGLQDDPLFEATPNLLLRRHSFLFGVTNVDIVLAWKIGIIERTAYYPEGGLMPPEIATALSVEEILTGAAKIQSEVNSLTIGPITFATIPGELYPELWLAGPDGQSLVERPENADYPEAPIDPPLRLALPENTIPASINVANDAIGYFIPMAQFDQEPPFAYLPEGQYGEVFSLGFLAAPTLDAAIRETLAINPSIYEDAPED